MTGELAFERSGPERFLSSFSLLVELVRALGPDPSDAATAAIGRLAAHIMTLRRLSRSVAGMLQAGENPALQAALVKDLGALVEQEIPEIARGLVEAEPDLTSTRDFCRGASAHDDARAVVLAARRDAGDPARDHRPGPWGAIRRHVLGASDMTDKVLYRAGRRDRTITLNDAGAMRNPISEPGMVDGRSSRSCERLNQDRSGAGGDPDRRRHARSARAAICGRCRRQFGDTRRGAAIRRRSTTRHGIQRIPLAFEKLDVPIIAAVNGPAIGAGLDLACMCDMRIAAESARFAESFVKVGIVAGDGGAWLLPRVVGYAKACEMAFTGDMISAQEALACGLVSRSCRMRS